VWHSLAKLALQTESTLGDLDLATTKLGEDLRTFRDKVSNISTKETPSEQRKRQRQETGQTGSNTKESLIRNFKMDTSKIHELGHYVSHLKRLGPADTISTQGVSILGHNELHRSVSKLIHSFPGGKATQT
jgi:hypothetical protein